MNKNSKFNLGLILLTTISFAACSTAPKKQDVLTAQNFDEFKKTEEYKKAVDYHQYLVERALAFNRGEAQLIVDVLETLPKLAVGVRVSSETLLAEVNAIAKSFRANGIVVGKHVGDYNNFEEFYSDLNRKESKMYLAKLKQKFPISFEQKAIKDIFEADRVIQAKMKADAKTKLGSTSADPAADGQFLESLKNIQTNLGQSNPDIASSLMQSHTAVKENTGTTLLGEAACTKKYDGGALKNLSKMEQRQADLSFRVKQKTQNMVDRLKAAGKETAAKAKVAECMTAAGSADVARFLAAGGEAGLGAAPAAVLAQGAIGTAESKAAAAVIVQEEKVFCSTTAMGGCDGCPTPYGDSIANEVAEFNGIPTEAAILDSKACN